MPRSTPSRRTEVDALRHNDTRLNIPTNELRDFAGNDELLPTKTLYPRDPSLDPQLVWNGKDEQDERDLEVAAVPIYIQEKIQPQAIVEEVRRTAAQASSASGGEAAIQLEMFADFNGIEFEEMIEFYQHEQHWQNRMILGDSLLVMNSLAEKEGLKGKVQMIYLDPPYGIKFGSNWQVSTRKRDVRDGREEDLVRQPEQVRAFRDTWEKGIHSYLSYLRDRLVLARELLTDSGSIFVQIGDENVHLVRSLLDEVFGSENFVSLITFTKTTGAGSPAISTNVLASVSDYLVWFAKEKKRIKYNRVFDEKVAGEEGGTRYTKNDEFTGRVFSDGDLRSQSGGNTAEFEFPFEGAFYSPYPIFWKTTYVGLMRTYRANRLLHQGKNIRYKRYIDA